MNALTMLSRDHDHVKRLLRQLESTTERGVKTRRELYGRIREALTVHESIEEEIFYPALRKHPRAKGIVLEGIEEHNVVDQLMAELDDLDPRDETWGPKAKVMKENIEHHIEEEEGPMFASARRVFERSDLTELGRLMGERRAQLEASKTAG